VLLWHNITCHETMTLCKMATGMSVGKVLLHCRLAES